MDLSKVLPNDTDAERAILGAIMLPEEEAIIRIADTLPSLAFYREAHQKIYSAALGLFSKAIPIDLYTMTDALQKAGDLEKVGGLEYLNGLLDSVPTAANVEHHAGIVNQEYRRRRLLRLSVKIHNDCLDPTSDIARLMSQAELEMMDIESGKDALKPSSLKSLLGPAMRYVEDAYNTEGTIIGMSTGFYDLDKLISGLKNCNMIIVCGRPGMGKSMFVQNIAQHVAAELRHPCLLYSAEMSKLEIALRILASKAEVSSQGLQNGNIPQARWGDLVSAASVLSDAPIYIDDTPGLTPIELFARCRHAKAEHGIKLILVDYIQLMKSPRDMANRQEAMAEVSRGLKILAMKLNVPIVVVSQLSRSPENRPNKRPLLSDLRESGALEQDADVVVALYREAYYQKDSDSKVVEVEILKQRNGPTGVVKLLFDGSCVTFRNKESRWTNE